MSDIPFSCKRCAKTAPSQDHQLLWEKQKNIFSKDELEISFDDVATIGAYVILNKEIPKEAEKEAETVEVEIEDEDD